MPGGSTPTSSGAYQGDNGSRIFDATHNDIDESTIDVTCVQGSVEIQLQERIWWQWSPRNSWNLSAGGRVNTTVEVDSSWFDGDHRLYILATANGTSCNVNFTSRDR